MHKNKLTYLTRALMVMIIMPSFVFCHSTGQNKQTKRFSTITESFEADIDLSITATPFEVQLFEGQKTAVYTYKAELIKGEDSSLQEIPHSYLGPIIRVKPQQKVRIRFNNELSDESIIHWHGLHVPHEMDGHPIHVIKNGEQYIQNSNTIAI
ncbi:MAG: multicopper oxidase domain-containing protein [Dysgonamonadaceae bacterium]|nr:multicopper oxidase domain-containing protein [Dysgonamonadaceae bacterium]MDD4727675.1 multicopper oxidase domain-containing protein [Dysgonamonadaceae bacterium]